MSTAAASAEAAPKTTSPTQARILATLLCASSPVTTAAVRDALNASDSEPRLVIERVYAALVALQHRGAVRRRNSPCGRRPLWEVRVAATNCLDSPLDAHAVAEQILRQFRGRAWNRCKDLGSAALAAWLVVASQQQRSGDRLEWILRALPHRARWFDVAHQVRHDPVIRQCLLTVCRSNEREFGDITTMLRLAVRAWSSPSGPTHLSGAGGLR